MTRLSLPADRRGTAVHDLLTDVLGDAVHVERTSWGAVAVPARPVESLSSGERAVFDFARWLMGAPTCPLVAEFRHLDSDAIDVCIATLEVVFGRDRSAA